MSSPPTLPGGITTVLPIGLYMGSVGSEAPPPPPPRDAVPPRIKVSVIQDANSESARMKFFKDGHAGIHAEVRVNGGAWLLLTTSDESPMLEERPLPMPKPAGLTGDHLPLVKRTGY